MAPFPLSAATRFTAFVLGLSSITLVSLFVHLTLLDPGIITGWFANWLSVGFAWAGVLLMLGQLVISTGWIRGSVKITRRDKVDIVSHEVDGLSEPNKMFGLIRDQVVYVWVAFVAWLGIAVWHTIFTSQIAAGVVTTLPIVYLNDFTQKYIYLIFWDLVALSATCITAGRVLYYGWRPSRLSKSFDARYYKYFTWFVMIIAVFSLGTVLIQFYLLANGGTAWMGNLLTMSLTWIVCFILFVQFIVAYIDLSNSGENVRGVSPELAPFFLRDFTVYLWVSFFGTGAMGSIQTAVIIQESLVAPTWVETFIVNFMADTTQKYIHVLIIYMIVLGGIILTGFRSLYYIDGNGVTKATKASDFMGSLSPSWGNKHYVSSFLWSWLSVILGIIFGIQLFWTPFLSVAWTALVWIVLAMLFLIWIRITVQVARRRISDSGVTPPDADYDKTVTEYFYTMGFMVIFIFLGGFLNYLIRAWADGFPDTLLTAPFVASAVIGTSHGFAWNFMAFAVLLYGFYNFWVITEISRVYSNHLAYGPFRALMANSRV